ncbi:hypothetical protein [Agromyces aerolatus]|uniref:hypothetical protein n=1 Tax=Agromyces sp. LY-1074 TaxID=3074080 RepID=UPI002865032D|nr:MULTISPECIES: hypothetical protein [unclassified Agromyces]MDR5699620.1 hypothetical protein [Agromyces sp. LY-1074]MDR5705916.1 hypothetical protein [Agromyces sp. LY-1358]
MGSGLAWLVIGAGFVASMWSMRMLLEANADCLIPYLARPERLPGWSIALRSIGAGLVVFGVGTLALDIGMWSVAIVVLATLPPLVWMHRHNRRLERRQRQDDTA